MALTSWNNILNKPKAIEKVNELEVSVAALSASVLTIGEKVENIETYKTEEHVVGKWVDGSSIYEKTFRSPTTLLINAADWTNDISFVDASNIDLLIGAEVIRTIGATSTYGFLQCALSANKAFNIYNARNLAVEIDTITLRYTKTAAETKKRTTKKK